VFFCNYLYLKKEVCNAIYTALREEAMPDELSEERWKDIADCFEQRWNLPHACGALDGKHIRIKKPAKSGSLYYNYKGFFSVVLLALVDADYKFVWVSMGSYGSCSDAQVYNNSDLSELLESNELKLPPPEPITADPTQREIPYFLIGDDAFPLREYMLKPYSRRYLEHDERIFNYRLSRARRVVENAFGIMASRFQLLLGLMQQRPENVDKVILACTVLHNMIRIREGDDSDLDHETHDHRVIPGRWRQAGELLDGDHGEEGSSANARGNDIRDHLAMFFTSGEGEVEWQEDVI